MSLELRRVTIRVEGLFKGKFDKTELSFLYYRSIGAWNGLPPNLLYVGERAVFYLVKDGGTLRATNDAYLSHTEVVTGKHSIQAVVDNEAVRGLIARVLLLPGEGLDIGGYLASLRVERAISLDVTSHSETVALLRILLGSSSGQVRARSCILLAEPPLHEQDCLPDVVRESGAALEDRQRAIEMLKGRP